MFNLFTVLSLTRSQHLCINVDTDSVNIFIRAFRESKQKFTQVSRYFFLSRNFVFKIKHFGKKAYTFFIDI